MLGRSPAAIVLLNLEDLWAETEPQNVPGTLPEANWTRKSRLTLEEMENSTDIPPVFAALRSAR
jgi:4-alpha-glucanotransferase